MRKALREFANAMEKVLKDNDYKGGWLSLTTNQMFNGLVQEIFELHEAILNNNSEAIQKEACDVANYAMFIFDERRFT